MQRRSMAYALPVVLLASAACGGQDDEAKKSQCRPRAAAAGYAELDSVPNAGSVSGSVTYAGSAKDTSYTASKDFEVCGQGEKPEGTLLAAQGKLRNAVVVVTEIAEGKKLPDKKDFVVDNVACMFSPRVQLGYAGGDLVAKNSDKVLHNIHPFVAEGNKNVYNVPLPEPGEIRKPMKKRGLLSVRCDAHGWMQGWVYVAEHPYVAVTGEDGSYQLDGLPPGQYTLRVWHERLAPVGKEVTAQVTIPAGGAATQDFALKD